MPSSLKIVFCRTVYENCSSPLKNQEMSNMVLKRLSVSTR